MNHLYKVLGGFIVFIVTFTSIYLQNTEDFIFPGIFSLLAFFLSLFLFFKDKDLSTHINGEYAFCVGVGTLLGLGIAYLFSSLFISHKQPGVSILLGIALGYLGFRSGALFSVKPGLAIFGGGGVDVRTFTLGAEKQEEVRDKILDTSVVIDGRILDIADTHFIDGPLILPNFVLREIQLISDSSDPIKRARGRRGLDMLNKLQRKGSIEVKITYTDYTDTREVDAKLIKLARDTGGKLVTNDFNLNKVAELQGVKVLNLNNLANALKPVVLPGEELTIQVIKEGKDENQGIGYLEDGTMVVIENGGHLVGKDVKVSVTSIIQTAAGKMIFTKALR
jgi:uncharacterized protein YacL